MMKMHMVVDTLFACLSLTIMVKIVSVLASYSATVQLLGALPQEFLYAEISLKPFIILLWIGSAVAMFGLIVATAFRGRMAGQLAAKLVGGRNATAKLKKNGKREAA